jgi:hypothetical protein
MNQVETRRIVATMAGDCHARGLVALAEELDALARRPIAPTTGACQTILAKHLRAGDLSQVHYRVLRGALSLSDE